METGAALFHSESDRDASPVQNDVENCGVSQRAEEVGVMPATDEAKESSRGGPVNSVIFCSGDGATSSDQQEEEYMDEDDLPTEQTFHDADHGNKPPPAILREIDQDGNETIIRDHSTSVGFNFQNTLMFELD